MMSEKSDKTKAMWADPEKRAKVVEGMKAAWAARKAAAAAAPAAETDPVSETTSTTE
jgi:hypothetical protein